MRYRDARTATDEIEIRVEDLRDPVESGAGWRAYEVDCRARFTFNIGRANHGTRRVSAEEVATADVQVRQLGEDEEMSASGEVIEGIASSTSIDWYGTRMSREALDMMADQFRAGVPYLPKHGSMFETMEWDDVIGMSFEAEVREGSVKMPRDESERQFNLYVRIGLYDEPAARALVRRIDRGEKIGQSIGGWFTKLRVVTNEEGDVTDVIVLGVELDHLAVTRAPANPDSDRLRLAMRSALDAAIRGAAEVDGGYATADARAERHGKAGKMPELDVVTEASDDSETRGEEVTEREFDTHQQIQPMCSLSVSEDDDWITLSFDPSASPEDIRAATAQLRSGEHGESIARVLETAGIGRSEPEPETENPPAEAVEEPPVEDDETSPGDPPEGSEAEPEGDATPAGDPGIDDQQETNNMDEAMLAAIRAAVAEGVAQGMTAALALQSQTQQPAQPAPGDTAARSSAQGGNQSPAAPPAPPAPQPAQRATTEVDTDLERIRRELDAQRARAERAEARVADMATRPVRQGEHNRTIQVAIRGGASAENAWEKMSTRAREEGAIALPCIVERSAEVLSDRQIAKRSAVDLEFLLADGLNAAMDDGLLVPPSQYTSWAG